MLWAAWALCKNKLQVADSHCAAFDTVQTRFAEHHDNIVQRDVTMAVEMSEIGTRGRAILHEHLQKALDELVADNARRDFQGAQKGTDRIPPDLLVRDVVSTFILVLNWWVESRSPLPPKEANDLFRALILPTLRATGIGS